MLFPTMRTFIDLVEYVLHPAAGSLTPGKAVRRKQSKRAWNLATSPDATNLRPLRARKQDRNFNNPAP